MDAQASGGTKHAHTHAQKTCINDTDNVFARMRAIATRSLWRPTMMIASSANYPNKNNLKRALISLARLPSCRFRLRRGAEGLSNAQRQRWRSVRIYCVRIERTRRTDCRAKRNAQNHRWRSFVCYNVTVTCAVPPHCECVLLILLLWMRAAVLVASHSAIHIMVLHIATIYMNECRHSVVHECEMLHEICERWNERKSVLWRALWLMMIVWGHASLAATFDEPS